MFILVDKEWLSAAKAYCFEHPLETLEIAYFLTHCHLADFVASKRGGNLYAFIEDDAISGLVLFNHKGVMHLSIQSDDLFKKVDFLKAIHKEKPSLVRGTQRDVDKVFYFLQRALKKFEFFETVLMVYEGPGCVGEFEDLADADAIDWHKHGNFLMEVDKHFREKTLTLNNIRQRIASMADFDFYKLQVTDGHVVGQVIGDFSTWGYSVIGGLYVRPAVRKKGIAKHLMCYAIDTIIKDDRLPALYVATKNQSALKLYDQMGFKVAGQMMDMFIQL